MSGEEVFANWIKTTMGWSANPGATPEGTDDQAAAMDVVRRAQADAERQVRSRTAPGDQARLVGIARAHLAARARAEIERQKRLDDVAATASLLRTQLFGSGGRRPTPDEIALRRQSDEIASRIDDPRDAARLLAKATRDGDEILARSIFERASEYASGAFGGAVWGGVLDAYTSTRPDAAQGIARLRDLPDYTSPRARLAFEAEHHVPTPAELGRLNTQQIEALANSDLAD